MTTADWIISFVKNSIGKPSNIKTELAINNITTEEAELLSKSFGIEVKGYVRKIDNFSILHTLKQHGDEAKEEKRGQVAITIEDFALIIEIAKVENAVYKTKNKLRRDCIVYCYKRWCHYYYVEEVRTGKQELVLNTMYKIKPPRQAER